jgi:transcriptional regulator with XRE-family HTH domain
MIEKSTLIQKQFGNRIRELRIKANLSQEKLGFETSLDRTYISGIERGQRNPSLKNINKIAKALKISLHELLKY